SANFNGTDQFNYTIDDGGVGLHVSNIALVNIVINAVNDPPVANGDIYGLDEPTLVVTASQGVLANDTDADPSTGTAETLTAILPSQVAHGTLTLAGDGSFSYVPSAGFIGTDSFTYQVDDGGVGLHLSNSATVTIVVANEVLVANNDTYTSHYSLVL